MASGGRRGGGDESHQHICPSGCSPTPALRMLHNLYSRTTSGQGKSGGSGDVTSQQNLLPILEATSVHLVLEGWLFPARQHLTQTHLQEADRLLVVTVALT